jgi:drug/metabolite transporter (DMT)-like permease
MIAKVGADVVTDDLPQRIALPGPAASDPPNAKGHPHGHFARSHPRTAALPLATVARAVTILAPLPPSALRVHLALITVSVLFGANYVFTKRILDTVSPAAWIMFRIMAATVVIVPLAMALRRGKDWPRPRLMMGLFLAAFFGVFANHVLFTEGMARTTPEHSAVINACIPTWTLIVAVIAGQERLGWRRIAAILAAMLGVQYLLGIDQVLFGERSAIAPDARGASLLGDVLTLVNGLSFAVHLVIMRRLGRNLNPWLSTAILFVMASMMVGTWCGPQIQNSDLDAVLTPPTLWFALYAVFFATVLTYLLNTWALRHTHSSQVAIYINVQPLVAATLNWALGAPLPGHRFFVAVALVGLGLWLQNTARRN